MCMWDRKMQRSFSHSFVCYSPSKILHQIAEKYNLFLCYLDVITISTKPLKILFVGNRCEIERFLKYQWEDFILPNIKRKK